MRRAITHYLAGTWMLEQARATVTLPFDDRHRRRIVLRDDAGVAFLLDLPEAAVMGDGDGLGLEGGGFIRVCAAEEAVVDFSGQNGAETARLAWHVGNRHVPLQVFADGTLRIRDDHVIVAMLEGLGARIERRQAPFTPEHGAYAHGPSRAESSRQHEDHAHGSDRTSNPPGLRHKGIHRAH